MHKILEHMPAWNGWIALLLYWLPLALCAYGYTVRGVKKYREELAARAKAEADSHAFYYPELTVGDLLTHVLATLCPAVNLMCLIFDLGSEMISDLFDWVGNVLDIPLVPKRQK